MSKRTTRRQFLGESVAAATGLAMVSRTPLWAKSTTTYAANEKLDIAVVGCSRRGGANLAGVAGESIVALCDVDERAAAKARKAHPKAKFHVDFRRMLDQKGIDAVVVSTPDHTHAPATTAALRADKHVYCEKPLTHTVYETREVTELAAKKKLATQMGTQIHASDNYRRVVELVRAGAVGEVREVHVWCGGGQAPGDRPKETPPIPEGLHYDLWIGPAPYRPYHPAYLPGQWRGWWDFGGGRLGDMGCHLFDLAHWALDLRYVTAVEAEGPPVHPESTPAWMIARYDYPARGTRPPVKLTWYHGDKRPPLIAKGEQPRFKKMGVLFVGEKGMLISNYKIHALLPQKQYADFKRPPRSIPKSIGHHAEWIRACKTGQQTTCHFGYAGPLTEVVLLGNVAYRGGDRIEWDRARMRIPNAPEAERFLRQPYRKGWRL